MNLSLIKLRSQLPELNRRRFTEADFWRICKREKIIVREMPLVVSGYYEFYKGRHYIIINRDLKGWNWLITAYHELIHYFLHNGRTMFKNGRQSREETEADVFALIAVLPQNVLDIVSHEDLEDSEFAKLFTERMSVFLRFGI